MNRLVTIAVVVLLTALPAVASNAVSLGYSDETTIVGPERECSGGMLIYNHDGSFENGYMWRYGGSVPPYFGALGEGYDLGAGIVRCGAYWLTALPDYMMDPPWDCYIWEGGVDSAPGAVLAVVTGVVFSNIPYWPTVRQNDLDLNVAVSGDFTTGLWADASGHNSNYIGADENGPRGHPWTCIAPGIGYPSGWQDPAIVWPNAKSMGCGVYFESNPTPAESPTWGAIKAMFR